MSIALVTVYFGYLATTPWMNDLLACRVVTGRIGVVTYMATLASGPIALLVLWIVGYGERWREVIPATRRFGAHVIDPARNALTTPGGRSLAGLWWPLFGLVMVAGGSLWMLSSKYDSIVWRTGSPGIHAASLERCESHHDIRPASR